MSPLRRRDFLKDLSGTALALALPLPVDKAAAPAGFGLELGYAAITWGGKDRQAIEDIAAVGFHGIQLRTSVLAEYGDKPAELRRILEEKGLQPLCFSSGSVEAVGQLAPQIETHVGHARFVAALGGSFLQLISTRPKDRAPTRQEFKFIGALLTGIGTKTHDLGVRVVYHNHMHAFSESPEELARLLDLTDPRYVSLLLDVAHYAQGGGDPVAAVKRHRDRLAVVHLKDVIGPLPGATGDLRYSYKFVELGRGRVDLPGVVGALKAVRFHGPAIVELDAPPEPEKTPKDCALINKAYVTEKLGLAL